MDPESQELQLRRAGVPWENLFRDIGISGSTGTQERRGWHRLDNRLGRRRYPGGGGHRPHRSNLAGHRQVHLRSPGPRGQDSFPGRGGSCSGPATWEADEGSPREFFSGRSCPCSPPGWRTRSWSPSSRRTRDGLERARQQGKVLGPPHKVGPGQLAGDAVDAGRRRQPPDDRQRLRVLTQHRDAGAAAGRGGAMTTDVPQPKPHCLPAGLLLARQVIGPDLRRGPVTTRR